MTRKHRRIGATQRNVDDKPSGKGGLFCRVRYTFGGGPYPRASTAGWPARRRGRAGMAETGATVRSH